MAKILISACFLGEKVRYDGAHNQLFTPFIHYLQQHNKLISICPEVCGGLSIPREPAEILSENKQVYTASGINVTAEFNQGAQQALLLCQQHKIKYALLKESSPSCGSQTIYDGTFNHHKISGQGITTLLLRSHGISVYSEKNIDELIAASGYIKFL